MDLSETKKAGKKRQWINRQKQEEGGDQRAVKRDFRGECRNTKKKRNQRRNPRAVSRTLIEEKGESGARRGAGGLIHTRFSYIE